MSKVCPSCLRPVRSGVNYCGYCGTSLVPTPDNPAPTNRSFAKQNAKVMANRSAKKQRVSKSGTGGRAWIKVPITLLVLVILFALAVRYWPQILIFIGQAAVFLKLT